VEPFPCLRTPRGQPDGTRHNAVSLASYPDWFPNQRSLSRAMPSCLGFPHVRLDADPSTRLGGSKLVRFQAGVGVNTVQVRCSVPSRPLDESVGDCSQTKCLRGRQPGTLPAIHRASIAYLAAITYADKALSAPGVPTGRVSLVDGKPRRETVVADLQTPVPPVYSDPRPSVPTDANLPQSFPTLEHH
jgi:hypothetical protein